MGSLTYSHTLTAGTTENINDVQDMFNDAKTVLNGNIDGYNAPNLLTQYRLIQFERGSIAAASITGALTFIAQSNGQFANVAGNGGFSPVILASGNYTVAGLTTKLRLRASISSNATAFGMNFTFGLYPISALAGGLGALVVTLGAVTAGSTVAINAPGAGVTVATNGSDFTFPADGTYVLGYTTSGAAAANACGVATAMLEMRWT